MPFRTIFYAIVLDYVNSSLVLLVILPYTLSGNPLRFESLRFQTLERGFIWNFDSAATMLIVTVVNDRAPNIWRYQLFWC